MNIDLIKKYGLIAITMLVVSYGIYLIWFLYSSIYQPLFIETILLNDSNKYEIPDAQITKVKTLLQTKSESRIDVTNVRNPFIGHSISPDATVTDVDSILDSPENDSELGRPE